jgi:hypothetical protein
MGWATFLAFFSQTHLVTLFRSKSIDRFGARREAVKLSE